MGRSLYRCHGDGFGLCWHRFQPSVAEALQQYAALICIVDARIGPCVCGPQVGRSSRTRWCRWFSLQWAQEITRISVCERLQELQFRRVRSGVFEPTILENGGFHVGKVSPMRDFLPQVHEEKLISNHEEVSERQAETSHHSGFWFEPSIYVDLLAFTRRWPNVF